MNLLITDLRTERHWRPGYDLLSLATGIDGLSARRNQDLGLAILQQTLATSGYAPNRSFRSLEEFQIYFQKHKTLIVVYTKPYYSRVACMKNVCRNCCTNSSTTPKMER